jgi:hypothetical protein
MSGIFVYHSFTSSKRARHSFVRVANGCKDILLHSAGLNTVIVPLIKLGI